MALTTLLKGRVKNTTLPKTHALLPLLEAIVNGVQAVDARWDGEAGKSGRIRVDVLRDSQYEFEYEREGLGRPLFEPIVGFRVEDNGIGFTPENMQSFETLDSEHKQGLGCRGVGRLLWLKAFERVYVRSAFADEKGALHGRQFKFSVDQEVEHDGEAAGFIEPGASVHLDGFKKIYREHAPKGGDLIAREILEHCVWYFLRPGGAPQIMVVDGDEIFSLADLMDDFVDDAMWHSTIEVKGFIFDMLNLRLKPSSRNSTPHLHWCAASRVVTPENLNGKVPGLHGKLTDDESGEFVYACYLSSDFLDNNVRSDRTAFDIPARGDDDAVADEPTLDDIRDEVHAEIGRLLSKPLEAAQKQGRNRVHDFVSTKAPRYRPLLAKFEEQGLTVAPDVKDRDLELQLHRQLQKAESEAFKEGQALFAESDSEPSEDYQERLEKYLDTIGEINKSDLAAYVSRRRVVLDLLAQMIRADREGNYSREDAIHQLIVPMRVNSNEIAPEGSNLWIIDERLAFHDYLALDTTFKKMVITDSKSTQEPDILATRLIGSPVLAAEGEGLPLASITVVEIKRPMRQDAAEGKNPIEQCLGYVNKIREGQVKTVTGRKIPESHRLPAFCYIIADLTPKMIANCRYANLQQTHDGLGYFGYNVHANAYIEVTSFDRLVNAATERNRAFFDKLGLPAS